MDRTAGRFARRLSVALVLLLAQACGNGSDEGTPGEGATAQAPPQPVQTTARDSAPSPESRAPAAGNGLTQQVRDVRVAQQVRAAVRERVLETDNVIRLLDPQSGRELALTFDSGHKDEHQELRTTNGGRYVVCVDFHTADGTRYDVDYYVGARDGKYVVEDVVMHKANGEIVLPHEQRDRLDRAG